MHPDTASRTPVRDHQTTHAKATLDDAFANLDLNDLGWPRAVRAAPAELLTDHPDAHPARVVRVDRGRMLLVATGGSAPIHARDRSDETDPAVVGDWVLVEPPELGADGFGFARARLPRTSVLARRRDTDSTVPQALAANVDLVLVVEALAAGRQPNEGRVARLVALARASGADAHVLLTHADTWGDALIPTEVAGAPALATSIVDGRGFGELADLLGAGVTATLVGASGSGKSSIVNALHGGALRAVAATRGSGTGRHTTATSQLVPLASGALLADTPGIRAVGMHADVDVATLAPSAITRLAPTCRFGDCLHDGEPGCAVQAAIDRGDLDPDSVTEWRKLEREALRERARADARLRRELKSEQLVRAKGYTRARRRGEIPDKRR
ncbi:MAG: rsgA [Thermoleophilia bacterium]|nr:rsgA [Thermoleophilia bacterium]